MVIWITGLPGAGKTTIATMLMQKLRKSNKQTLLIDGDMIRDVLQQRGYDNASRKKLAFTYARLAKMFSLQGSFAICATVSMFDEIRKWNAQNISEYFEVYIKVPEEVLHIRNQKELYSKAKLDKIENVPSVNQSIEEPKSPNLIINNDNTNHLDDLVNLIYTQILRNY